MKLILCVLSLAMSAMAGYISNLVREVKMLETDLTISTSKLTFFAANKQETKFFYTVPIDFQDTLVALIAKDTMNRDLEVQPISANNETHILYHIDVEQLIGERGLEINLEITEMHKNRRVPHPQEATIIEIQKIQFADSCYFFSKYKVLKQDTYFLIPERQIVAYTKLPHSSKYEDGLKFGPYTDVQPFTFELANIFYQTF